MKFSEIMAGQTGAVTLGEIGRAAIAKTRRKRNEAEFLPAALEVLEKPASPTSRWFAFGIAAFTTIALLWAYFGKVDIVAVAQGRIIPTGNVKTIKPLEPGVVRSIHVRDGDLVTEGELLIELDPTEASADRDSIALELMTGKVAIARIRALLGYVDDIESTGQSAPPTFAAPDGADPAVVEVHRDMLLSQVGEFAARLANIDREIERLYGEIATVTARTDAIEQLLPMLRESRDLYANLSKRQLAARTQYLDAKQRVVAQESEQHVQRKQGLALGSALAAKKEERRFVVAAFRRQLFEQLTEAEQRSQLLRQELAKATERYTRQRIHSPISGTVQQLTVHTIGGVIMPAEELLHVVPNEGPLEIDAWIENKDIAFVEPGQRTEIKVETLPFTRYGVLHGEVIHVGKDAVVKDGSDGILAGVYFPARIKILQDTVEVDGREIRLSSGMNITAEIQTGNRRVVEYVLSPLLRYTQEAIRER